MPGSTTTSGGGAIQGKLIFTSTWANAGTDSRAANAAASRLVLMARQTSQRRPGAPRGRGPSVRPAARRGARSGGGLHPGRCGAAEVLQRAAQAVAQRDARLPAEDLLRQRRVHAGAELLAGLAGRVLRRL